MSHQSLRVTMYLHRSSLERGFLKVSDVHTIYYEVFGNPEGKPAVFLHGGPGAGCSPRHAGFFDPGHYKVVLLDQRGCGKSTPRGCLEENTTWDLVEDLERLRKHLRVHKWLVMGGSWGVTLALAYGEAYPSAVAAFILRGVCMLRQEELDWFYKQGANALFPFAWNEFVSILEPSEQRNVICAFYKRLVSDQYNVQLEAAKAWSKWGTSLSFFSQNESTLSWNGKQYAVEVGNSRMQLDKTSEKEDKAELEEKLSAEISMKIQAMPHHLAQALLECHYFINAGFLKENELLERISRICHIPCVIVHGRYDFVCPVKNAFDLHHAWPSAELYIVPNAGHSMYEKGITHKLLSAAENFKLLEY